LPNSKGPPSSLVQLSAANIRDDALVTHDLERTSPTATYERRSVSDGVSPNCSRYLTASVYAAM
jgi:hypothetical protein